MLRETIRLVVLCADLLDNATGVAHPALVATMLTVVLDLQLPTVTVESSSGGEAAPRLMAAKSVRVQTLQLLAIKGLKAAGTSAEWLLGLHASSQWTAAAAVAAAAAESGGKGKGGDGEGIEAEIDRISEQLVGAFVLEANAALRQDGSTVLGGPGGLAEVVDTLRLIASSKGFQWAYDTILKARLWGLLNRWNVLIAQTRTGPKVSQVFAKVFDLVGVIGRLGLALGEKETTIVAMVRRVVSQMLEGHLNGQCKLDRPICVAVARAIVAMSGGNWGECVEVVRWWRALPAAEKTGVPDDLVATLNLAPAAYH